MIALSGTTNLILTLVVVPAVILIGALVLSHRYGHIVTTARLTIWLSSVAYMGLFMLLGLYIYSGQDREYRDCVSRAEGRDVVIDTFIGIADGVDHFNATISTVGLPQPVNDGLKNLATDIRSSIAKLPRLDPDDCPQPLNL